ncbi:alkaline phosphatase [Crocosphaera sp. XPORK-15E]|uniref:alkaline phosphatase n=1 Tax=Crocosphaera sp. XPORK-15E TaxID=3110247 RepID=UPI002B21488F|nr:alkaline phosphatase [Crocosphaera sp. XPORK-15E]MEA5534874.1 alkaline phosphatase [Crocosphaera sp. XPORK-15E]
MNLLFNINLNSTFSKAIAFSLVGLVGTISLTPNIAQAATVTNTKNVIIMIGDGMGWEMARAAAIQEQINAGNLGNSLIDFYTSGKGSGLAFQELSNYVLSTTYGTTIAPANGTFNTSNSAIAGNNITGEGSVLPGFVFDPTFNPGTTPTGGASNPNSYAVGNLVGYDPVRGGATPWDAAYYGGAIPSGFDKEYIKYSYPDSANTATTLYTGVKSYNSAIGVDIYEQPLDSALKIASEAGKSTGLVTSVPIDHATPGAAAANVNRRNKLDQPYPLLDNILQQELRIFQPTVLLGGGNPASNPLPLQPDVEPPQDFTYITQDTYDYLVANPNSNRYGYQFLESGPNATATLLAAAALIDPNNLGNRLLGLYGAEGQNGNLPINSADGTYQNTGLDMFSLYSSAQAGSPNNITPGIPNPDTVRPLQPGETDEEFIARQLDENPRLKDLTQAALTVLEKDPDGFWLMVEAGDIDWAAHDNNLDNLIGAMSDFNDSVDYVINWIANNGGWEQNLLIVTADHDHYFTLNDNFPELLRTVGAHDLTYSNNTPASAGHFWGSAGSDPANADSLVKYDWGTHSNRPVPVYFQGNGSEVLLNSVGQGYDAYGNAIPGIPGLVDQVHTAKTQLQALQTVPEPGSVLGFLAIGFLGLGSKLKQKIK